MCDIVKLPCAVSYCNKYIEMHLGHGKDSKDMKSVPRNAVLVYCSEHIQKDFNIFIKSKFGTYVYKKKSGNIICGVILLTKFAYGLREWVHPNCNYDKSQSLYIF